MNSKLRRQQLENELGIRSRHHNGYEIDGVRVEIEDDYVHNQPADNKKVRLNQAESAESAV